MMPNLDEIFQKMISQWASPIVARADVGKFTGGACNPKTLANADCLGDGPQGRFFIGRRVVYPVDSFVQWLRENSRRP